METQNSKLLQLVESCIDNKQFYINKEVFRNQNWNPHYMNRDYFSKTYEEKERIEVFYDCLQKQSRRLVERQCRKDNNSEGCSSSYRNDDFNKKLKSIGMGCENHLDKEIKLYEGMDIFFVDYPPIKIRICIKESESKKVSDFLIDEIKGEYKKETKWKFWQDKRTIYAPTGKQIKYNINEITTSYHYSVECGSVKEYISIEEYDKFFEKYKLNLEKFTKDIDEGKIEERLKKYKQ